MMGKRKRLVLLLWKNQSDKIINKLNANKEAREFA